MNIHVGDENTVSKTRGFFYCNKAFIDVEISPSVLPSLNRNAVP